MATTARLPMTVFVPIADIDVFKAIAEKFHWTMSISNQQVIKRKTSFQKSQDDIIAGRVNSYNNSDELFEKSL